MNYLSLKSIFIPKFIKTDILLNKITDLDENSLLYLKNRYNVEAIIVDVDDTLRKNMKPIPLYIKKWLIALTKSFKVIALSNGIDNNIASYLKSIGVLYIPFAKKPFKKSFIHVTRVLKTKPNRILVIGDSLFNDVLGGKRCSMKTALVNKLR